MQHNPNMEKKLARTSLQAELFRPAAPEHLARFQKEIFADMPVAPLCRAHSIIQMFLGRPSCRPRADVLSHVSPYAVYYLRAAFRVDNLAIDIVRE